MKNYFEDDISVIYSVRSIRRDLSSVCHLFGSKLLVEIKHFVVDQLLVDVKFYSQ